MNAITHDTIRLTQQFAAPMAEVWEAYADLSKRAQWCVPEGAGIVYDTSDFREGGRESYRCGSPEAPEFRAEVEYTKVVPRELLVYTETVQNEGQPLATATLSWEFAPDGAGSCVTLTCQVVSFVGSEMVDSTRTGHTTALRQLGQSLARS